MSTQINYVHLSGRLGKDVQISTFESGKKKASFSMVTTESFKDSQGQSKEVNTWHNIVAWGKLAEELSNLTKGKMIEVKGSINNRAYKDKDDNTRYITEINCKECRPTDDTL